MIKHNDELSALIHACGPRIKDETIGLEDLEKRFEAVEDLRRDLEGRRQFFKRGFLFGLVFGIFSVLWLGRSLLIILLS